MAKGTYAYANLWYNGASRKRSAATDAGYCDLIVLWMDVFFHSGGRLSDVAPGSQPLAAVFVKPLFDTPFPRGKV